MLHQDDFVLPGFYDVLRKGAEHSAGGAIFCRYATTNSKEHWLNISELYRESAGLLEDWHARSLSSNEFTVQPLLFEDSRTSRSVVFCRNCTMFSIAKCGNELPLNFHFGSSPRSSLVVGCIRVPPVRV